MKLLSIRFNYEGSQDEIDSLERAIAVQAPGVELTQERCRPGSVDYRADSHDPIDFYKVGMIAAINIRAYADRRQRVKSN